ncbi:MAG TPA: hypothetical protein VNA12_03095 [Mycobacteriales bacterium]|nr:hypothetical protein [Mycobacteriales bacterium]
MHIEVRRLAAATMLAGALLVGALIGPTPAYAQAPTPTPTAAASLAPVAEDPILFEEEARAPFAYPAVFLVPIALLGGAAWAARAFTRDLSATDV